MFYLKQKTEAQTIDVALITHITHVRNMRKKTIYNKVALTSYIVFLSHEGGSLWKQVLSFKSSRYFGSDSRHTFQDFSWVCVKMIPF